ncbi:Dehydrin like [Actinidia chinensis var. chinensis]|uniref:Dehydrin like n=1 Tax=Actinidia chinensis var. chinensis TaxID=1590841 RepID=A0A2R6QI21_ACTCC|nr:Dehydrin like [Actinidia chinensis var. chinensis]
MAEPLQQCHGSETATKETTSLSLFDCFGKKEEKPGDDNVMTDLETVQVSKPDKMEEEKHTLMEELHQARSNSSSSSDEEEQEGGEKKRKKKGLKEEVSEHKDASVSTEKCDQEEKKGFLEKIKEKLASQHKEAEECGSPAAPPECAADNNSPGGETKDKKGILEKIKEKLPRYHKNDEDDMKEKEKEKEN